MKKIGLSLAIPSDEEEENQNNVEYHQQEEGEYLESEGESYERSYSSEEKEYQEDNVEDEVNDEDKIGNENLIAPEPPTISKKGIGFENKFGFSLNVEDNDKSEGDEEKNLSEKEISEKSIEEEPEHARLDDGIQIEGCESTGDISYKWVQALKNIQIVEKGINFSQFYKSFALRETSQEFKLIRKLTETDCHNSQIVKRK